MTCFTQTNCTVACTVPISRAMPKGKRKGAQPLVFTATLSTMRPQVAADALRRKHLLRGAHGRQGRDIHWQRFAVSHV